MARPAFSALIVDADPDERANLQTLLHQTGTVQVCGAFGDAEAALTDARFAVADLLFMDIRLNRAMGQALLNAACQQQKSLFLTADTNHAAEAFEFSALDYLLKPYRLERLEQALARLLPRSQPEAAAGGPTGGGSTLFVRLGTKYVRLAVDQIQWIESNGDYAFVYTQERRFVVHTSLKTIAQKLPTGRFLRVHRRYIVHLDSIQEIDQDTLVLAGRQFIPIGKAYRPALLQSVTVL